MFGYVSNLYGATRWVARHGPVVNRCGGNATIIDGNAPFRAFRGLADVDDGTCLIGGSIHGNNSKMQ